MTKTSSGRVNAPWDYHSVMPVAFEDSDIGELFYFYPPGRHVFESACPELRALERIAWFSESEALEHIQACAQVAITQTSTSPPPPNIDAYFDTVSLVASESIVVGCRELGAVFWDSLSRKCGFQTARPELSALERITWSCPASARLHILAFDQGIQRDASAEGLFQ